MSILNRFEQNKELLSNQELSIFQQIWQNLSTVQDKTLSQVVDLLHISRQSFLRVAKKLDYKDSSEFLLALNQQTVFENIEDTAKASPTILNENIHQIINHLDQTQIKKFIQHINKSQRIFILSTGKAQDNQGEVLSAILAKQGYFVIHIYDFFEIEEIKANVRDTDMFVILTRTGTSHDLLNAVRSLNQTAADIVTITSMRSNPLSSWSNLMLFVNTQKIDGNIYELNAMFYVIFGLIDFYLNLDDPVKPLKDQQQLIRNILGDIIAKNNASLTTSNRELMTNLMQKPELLFKSISAISEQLNISTTSLFRLAQSLGFNGFKEFRASIRLAMADFKPQKSQYDNYLVLLKYFNKTVNDIMGTDFTLIHSLIFKHDKICLVYQDKYTEILADELIRTFFHTNKLMRKINGSLSADYVDRYEDTLFIFLIKNRQYEEQLIQTLSHISNKTNDAFVFSEKEIAIEGFNVSGAVFFPDVPNMIRSFADMWLIEFLFISYLY